VCQKGYKSFQHDYATLAHDCFQEAIAYKNIWISYGKIPLMLRFHAVESHARISNTNKLLVRSTFSFPEFLSRNFVKTFQSWKNIQNTEWIKTYHCLILLHQFRQLTLSTITTLIRDVHSINTRYTYCELGNGWCSPRMARYCCGLTIVSVKCSRARLEMAPGTKELARDAVASYLLLLAADAELLFSIIAHTYNDTNINNFCMTVTLVNKNIYIMAHIYHDLVMFMRRQNVYDFLFIVVKCSREVVCSSLLCRVTQHDTDWSLSWPSPSQIRND